MIICLFKAEPHKWTCPHSDIGGLSSWQVLKNRRPSAQKPPSLYHVFASLPLEFKTLMVSGLKEARCFPSLCDGGRSCAVASPPLKLTSSCRFTFTLGCWIFHCCHVCAVSIAGWLCLLSMVMSEIEYQTKYVYISIHIKGQTSA